MDKIARFLKKIDGKKVSFDKAFNIMKKLGRMYDKEKKNKQLEMELKFE